MAEGPGISDLFGALGGANPFSAVGKTVEQFRRSVDDLLKAVETFTATMDTLNNVAQRVNRLLDDVEEPIRAAAPQITATIKAADSLVSQLTAPVERVVPLMSSVADTLSAPGIKQLPDQLGQFLDVLGEVTERLSPLSGMLESAGGLFRNNPLRNMLGAIDLSPAKPNAPQPVVSTPKPAKPAATPATTKKTPTKKTAAKKTAAKKAAPAKKAAGRQR